MATASSGLAEIVGHHGLAWPGRVLVVDDHPFVRRALKDILLRNGIAYVSEAANGRDAIAQIGAPDQRFDVIFCDLQMPDMDGIETLRTIAEISAQAAVVLMSGEDPEIIEAAETLARARGLRTLGHLTKPITAERVRHILTSKAASPTAAKAQQLLEPITDAEILAGLRAGEFHVLFQPKIGTRSGELAAVEALVRWRSQRRGAVSPIDFIPIAEQSDTIDHLTKFVFESAIAARSTWLSAGRNISVAVNLSTRSMTRLDLPDTLAAIAAKSGADVGSFVLEVTESRVAESVDRLLDICARLRLKGFQLSIDDFGTGFSTLEQLRRLPFSELKVDQAFVSGAPEDPRRSAIFQASLELARNLRMRSVCEGVETEAEWNLAKALGADYIQGYFVAKPLTVEEVINWQFRQD